MSSNQEQVSEKKALPSGKDNFCHRFVLLFLKNTGRAPHHPLFCAWKKWPSHESSRVLCFLKRTIQICGKFYLLRWGVPFFRHLFLI